MTPFSAIFSFLSQQFSIFPLPTQKISHYNDSGYRPGKCGSPEIAGNTHVKNIQEQKAESDSADHTIYNAEYKTQGDKSAACDHGLE